MDDVRFGPASFTGLSNKQRPLLDLQLQQVLCAMNCVRTEIPKLTKLVFFLRACLERVCSCVGKRTKTAVALLPLSKAGWSQNKEEAFINCKNALANLVTHVHLNA